VDNRRRRRARDAVLSRPDGNRRNACGQADAAAAGALLLDDVEDEPESDFFDDESEEDELFASPELLDDDSTDTFSLAGLPESTEPARLSVR
jgi:hypothetical protein